jgi:Carboxypeptidase regulatory-like domain
MTLGRVVSLSVFGVICGAAAPGQSSGYVCGHIEDPSSAAVSGTAVTAINEESGFRHAASSSDAGAYCAGPLAPGLYKVTVRKEGFRTMIRFHVRVEEQEPARADFQLSLGSVLETVTVEDSLPARPEDDVAVVTKLIREDLEKLPLDGRGVLGLVELAPGVDVVPATRGDAGQFVADGQRPNTNYFTVDGISANHGVSAGGLPAQTTGGALPVLSAFGSLDSLIPVESIQEFEIRSSTAASQFGRLPGASIAITSRAGSGEFHGSAAYGFRNQLVSANDWLANRASEPRAAARESNLNATLGGPVWRNRTFFFAGYQRVSLLQPYTWLEPVPSLDARAGAPAWAQPALALFPEPNGPLLGKGLAEWNGQDSRPGGLQTGSARLDQVVTQRLALFARYSDSPSYNQFGTTQVNHLDFRSWSGTAGLNLRVASGVTLDFRVNESATAAQSAWSGATGCELQPLAALLLPAAPTCDALIRFDINGVGQVISGREGDRRQRQLQAVDSVSWKRASNVLQVGSDFLRIAPARRDANGTLSLIADSLTALDDSNSFWRATSPALSQSAVVDELSLWIHDTWKPAPHLTLVSGLRWEYSPPPATPPAGLDFLNPLTGTIQAHIVRPLWLKPYGHFAPRLGLAFSPGKSGRTVVRAGAGLYFDSSLSIATDVINGGPLSLAFNSARNGLFSTYLNYGFLPDLHLPEVAQWNASVERSLSTRDFISVGYVGSAGWRLIRREIGGPGSTQTNWEALTTNNGRSNYHALVAQYRRRVTQGLGALVSYSWSHALDNASSDSFLFWAGPGSAPARDRGASDFDLRHSMSASLDYALPGVAKGWSLAGTLRARSGFPITVLDSEQYAGIAFMNAFRPDLVPGVPVWIPDSAAPGGRILNPLAFAATKPGQQGDLGRNAITGFGMWQADLSLHREFRLADRRAFELRVEAFNALNHPNFADPVRYLNSPYFGQSTSMLNLMLGTGSPGSGLAPMLQTGGPRSLEATVRFRF